MSNNSVPIKCCAEGCSNPGKFICKRCKVSKTQRSKAIRIFSIADIFSFQTERYCSTSCQKSSWGTHKETCVGEVEKPYQFDESYDRTTTEVPWLRAEMQKAPDQPMDPPDAYDFYWFWWK